MMILYKRKIDDTKALLEKLLDVQLHDFIQLKGDASVRSYFRAWIDDDSWIVMDMGKPFSEKHNAFLLMQCYLAEHSISVPSIKKIYSKHGFIVLEDLGDITLQKSYLQNPQYTLKNLYPKVLKILHRLQNYCSKPANLSVPCFDIKFDEQQFMSELAFFVKHFLYAYLKLDLATSQLHNLQDFFTHISYVLAQQPTVLAHRDFHSRNLMVKNEKIFVIDFQDARLGLPQYDLASLLKDAYIELPDDFICQVINDFSGGLFASKTSKYSERDIFGLMSVQRVLKAMGTFGYQSTVMNNQNYLKYLPVLRKHLDNEMNRFDDLSFRKVHLLFKEWFSGIAS